MEDTAVVDAPVVDAAAPVDSTPAADPTLVDPSTATDPKPVDDNEAMWGDLSEEPAQPAADPQAIPEAYTKALSVSDYVKQPEHLEQAVRAAQEMWDVQTGKQPVTAILEAFRAGNAQQFEKMFLEQLVPYVEQLTGKKLGGAPEPDRPMTVQEYEQRRQADAQRAEQERVQAEQQREQAAFTARAEEAGGKHLATLISNGNGIFDGDTFAAVNAVSAQFRKMGIDAQQAMQKVMAGDFSQLEKAYKAAEKAETLRVKAYSDRIRAKYNTLKNSVPKTAASQGTALDAGNPDLTTKEGRARAMAKAFAEGRDTI